MTWRTRSARSYGLRSFAVVAILTLALGIGANTALFTVFNGLLIEKLPVHDPDELVAFRWFGPNDVSDAMVDYGTVTAQEDDASDAVDGVKFSGATFSLPAFQALRESNGAVTDVVAAAYGAPVSLVVNGGRRHHVSTVRLW